MTVKTPDFQNECEDQDCFFEIWGNLMVWFAMPFGIAFTYWILLVCVVKAPFIN
jgi:hypothetical protein